MMNIKLYDIHGRSAIANYLTLITPDSKYFYWDSNKFTKYNKDDIVFWVNRSARVALYTKIDLTDIKPSIDSSGQHQIIDGNYTLNYTAQDPSHFDNFYRFKIIDKVEIPEDWNYSNLVPFNSQTMAIILYESKFTEPEKKIQKIKDIQSLFSQNPQVQVLLDETITLLSSKIHGNLEPKVWFVTQGKSFEEDRGMKFLWAPQKDKRGDSNFHWDNVLKVKKGDIIFNYSGGLRGVSIALNDGYEAQNPDEKSDWTVAGYRVDIDLKLLEKLIPLQVFKEKKEEFRSYLSVVKYKPFDINGNVNQGYLYEFSKEAGKFIRDKLYGKPFGNKVIDDFFNSVDDMNGIVNDNEIDQEMKNFLQLIKYKKQIILQGPPGTGKTYTAKKIAKELVKGKSIGNAEDKINNFFKTFDSTAPEVQAKRVEYSELLNEFHSLFPADQLKDLTLQKYAIGTGERNNFCWWIERGLKPLGYYFPGSSRSYLIYWDKSNGEYSTHYKHSKTLSASPDIEEAMHRLAIIISELVISKSGEAFSILGDSFILKILNSYYPDEYFPVNSVKYLDNILKLFNVDSTGLSFIEKNQKVQQLYNEKKERFKSDVTNYEFMTFLDTNFDMKGDINVKEKSIFISGDYKLIQFHPSYTYEDFVRGIIAKTNDKGNVSYEVKDQILAEFAKKAEDNPSANFVLIIDEINRANLPSVLGELIYAMEYRFDPENPGETTVESMYSLNMGDSEEEDSRKLKLPGNLYIIGTMNTADRSVGHIDYAIRRRFAFVSVLPKPIQELTDKGKELFLQVAALFCADFNENDINQIPSEYLAPDFNPMDVMPGHSYFLIQDKEREELKLTDQEILKLKLEYEIKPILREYKKDGILLEPAIELIEDLHA
ncbi:AAA family ATPase [Bacteroidota bacterium]